MTKRDFDGPTDDHLITTAPPRPSAHIREKNSPASSAKEQLPVASKRAVLQQRPAQRLAIDLHCNREWTDYRTEWRFNPKADQYIVQKIRPLVDTDVAATPREQYAATALRLSFKCPGCNETLRVATECRFDRNLICMTVSSRSS